MRGFKISLVWCKSCKFLEFLNLIEHQKWVKLFGECAKSPLLLDPMKELCRKFKIDNRACSSVINGISVSFDVNYLENLFEVPNEGFGLYFKGKYNVPIGKATNNDIVSFIGGDVRTNLTNHNKSNPLLKLLFYLVGRSIVALTQKRNESNLLDASLMFCLQKQIHINFPLLMMQHLSPCIPKFKDWVWSLLTFVFQSFGVNLCGYGWCFSF